VVVAGTLRVRDVRFLAPFQVEGDAPRRLFLRLVRSDDALDVRIFADDEAMPCVTASVEVLETSLARVVPLHEIRGSACPEVEEIGGFMRQQFVDFGPRWSNLLRARYGTGQALIELELPDALRADLRDHPFHPALADMAIGSAQRLIPGFDPSTQFFVPISYDSVDFHAPLPERFVSHVRYVGGSAGQTAVFDVSLAEETGRVLVEVRGFTMRRVGKAAAIVAPAETSAAPKTPQAERIAELLEQAISPEEGAGAFLRALGSFSGVQCTISSVDPVAWLQELELDAQRSLRAPEQRAAGFARPSLRTPYVAPSTPEEKVVARIWSELLGIQEIGVNDDFGELGGQSLLAIRMVERIKRETGAQLALSTLFDAPTVARVAAKLGSRGPSVRTHHSIVPVREGGNHPPLFMPHGVGGTVHWGYANLAKHLDPRVPVIGLKVAPDDLTTFEDMCAFYVSEIRDVQPKGPYFLGGYCYGGNVAFEIARQLRNAGEEVALLALIEAWPVNTEFGKIEWSPAYAARFAENLPYFVSDFAARPRRDQWEAIQRKVGRLKERVLGPASAATTSSASESEQGLFDRLGPPPPGADLLDIRALARYGEGEMLVWERCIRALWQNVPQPIDVHGLVIRTRRQPLFSPLEPEMGWRPLLTRGLDAHTVAGSHFTIMDIKDVVAVAALLNAVFERSKAFRPRASVPPLPLGPVRAGAKR
jgi:thioesterase domain-containing protein